MDEDKKNNIVKGFILIILWFFVGAIISLFPLMLAFLGGMAGVFDPPAIWSLTQILTMYVLPFLYMLGGIPAAIQMMRGRPWRGAFWISFKICAFTWAMNIFALILFADY
jgi:hypothetical protein